MGTISFDKAKINDLADKFTTSYNSVSSAINNIKDQLSIIANKNNWSGDIANSANVDLTKAASSLDDILTNMNSVKSLIDTAANNFNQIKY